jgi:hypothetical protein
MEGRMSAVEKDMSALKDSFGRFVAATEAVAASTVTNRTFWLGVVVVVVAIVGMVVGNK